MCLAATLLARYRTTGKCYYEVRVEVANDIPPLNQQTRFSKAYQTNPYTYGPSIYDKRGKNIQ